MKNDYINLRNKYLPKKIKTIFVLESPPEGHGYFYDPTGKTSEVLFRAFMQLFKYEVTDKDIGLRKLAENGYVLMNPIYTPVNKFPDKEADRLILGNYSNFIQDLETLTRGDKTIPIILIKSNILRLLERKLLNDGYNVINKGLLVPFPLHYHIKTFLERVNDLMTHEIK
jgi:hypothetical protein